MKYATKILVMEEQSVTSTQLQSELGKEGILIDAKHAATPADFREKVSEFEPDLILIRHTMPNCDGIAAMAAARQSGSPAPVIFICAAEDAAAAFHALELGASDYVVDGPIERLAFAVRRALREAQEHIERKRTSEALQEMEERYRALFDRSLDCLYVHDFEGNFLDANPAALALLGYTREEIPSVNFKSLLREDQIDQAIKGLEEVRKTGRLQRTLEFDLRHKNGKHVVAEVKASLVLRNGKPFAIQGIGRETTERKRAEAELRRANRLYTVLSRVNQTLIRARTSEELLQQVCAIAVVDGGFKSARISRMDTESHQVVPVATAGCTEFLGMVPSCANDRPDGQCPTGIAIREGKISISNNFQADPLCLPWLKQAESSGVRAVASFPFASGENNRWALTLLDREANVFQEKEVALLSGVAEAVSYGLDRLEEEAQRKRAEELLKERQEDLRKSDARYRRLMQETGQVVYVYDLTSGRIEWEGAMAEVLGYTSEEMQRIGACEWEEMVHPEDREQTVARLENAIAGYRRYHVEYRFRRKDGEYILVDEHGSFLRDERGDTVQMLGTISDITERKNNEDRNREQARLLYLAHDAVLARNMDDKVTFWNESAERLYGWSAEEALGRNVDNLLKNEPSKAAESKRSVLQDDEAYAELVQTTKTGEQILVESRMTLVRDRQGHRKSILSINRDITARKKLEAQMLRSQRMESIGTLASGIAHDLNNVLAPILMSCHLLSTNDVGEEGKQWIEIISRSAKRGAELVKQVLSFCRGAEGRRVELQVRNLIGEINQIVRQTFPKSIEFQSKVSKDLWMVVAEPTEIHQVLLNLCVNARDAMPNGGVLSISAQNVLLESPRANLASDATPCPHLMITISDTGSGISPEIREKIFDPFFSTKELGKGTGLGLSTSLGIVKSHGGFINVYSEPNVGTVFKVYIPAVVAGSPLSPQTGDTPLPRGNGELALLVDDESAVRTITAQTLRIFGYNVITASDGAEAIELYGRHANEVAVILMDMMMPVMDGRATIQALSRRNRNLKVIAASGLLSDARMVEGSSDAVKAFLPKPYTAETLLKTMHMVLADDEKKPTKDAPAAAANDGPAQS